MARKQCGQFIEWDYQKGLDWHLLEYESHSSLKDFVKDLNAFYLKYPSFYELDNTYDGFKWLVVDDNIQNVVAFYREDRHHQKVIVIVNFSPEKRKGYEVGVPDSGDYKVILNSNLPKYGGDGVAQKSFATVKTPNHGHKQSLVIDLDGSSTLFLIKN
jgi:1,4-alpha-glucan branching enzyme